MSKSIGLIIVVGALMALGCAQQLSTSAAESEDKIYTVTPAKVTSTSTQSLDVEFLTEALKAKTLQEICRELGYIPSPYRNETANLTVSNSEGK
jgi:hypothetical protein